MNFITKAAIQFVIVIFSVVFHEVSHGVVARQRGDYTAERAGRLTLNPLPHIDPFGTIILPLLLAFMGLPVIGWAKPVPVQPTALRHPRHDWMMVSIAGPATNIALALIAALSLIIGPQPPDIVIYILIQIVIINVVLAVFNLIPLPPLDGSRVIMRILPPAALQSYLSLEGRTGMIILYILLATGVISRIIEPAVMFVVTHAIKPEHLQIFISI